MSKRLTRNKLDDIRRAYHMDLPKMGCQRVSPVGNTMYTCHLAVESLVDEVEACWRKRPGKDVGKLLDELRVLVGKMGLAVYEIKVRRAGYAVAYALMLAPECPSRTLRINKYYDTLREAVEGELAEMKKEVRG